MRKNDNFRIHVIAGINVLIPEAEGVIDYSKIYELNSTAYYLYTELPDGTDFTVKDMAIILENRYSIDPALALQDATAIASRWLSLSVILQ